MPRYYPERPPLTAPPKRPDVWLDERGFVRYGRAKLSVRIVGGFLEFVIKEPGFIVQYGRRVLVDVAELEALAAPQRKALDNGENLC